MFVNIFLFKLLFVLDWKVDLVQGSLTKDSSTHHHGDFIGRPNRRISHTVTSGGPSFPKPTRRHEQKQ